MTNPPNVYTMGIWRWVILRKTSINVTPEIDKLVSDYQEKNGITSWTAALFELARKGFEASK